MAGERKKARNFGHPSGLHPSGLHPSEPHSSGPHNFGPPQLRAPTLGAPQLRALTFSGFGPLRGPHPSGPHPSGPHPSGHPPSGHPSGPPLRGPTLRGPPLRDPTMTPKILAKKLDWPKLVKSGWQNGVGQSRSLPPSPPPVCSSVLVSKKLSYLRHVRIQREDDGAVEFWSKSKTIFRLISCTVLIGLMTSGRAGWQEEGRNKIRYQCCADSSSHSCTSKLSRTMLLFRANSPVHISYWMCNQFTPQEDNILSKRQTTFFTFLDPMIKEHRDPEVIDWKHHVLQSTI